MRIIKPPTREQAKYFGIDLTCVYYNMLKYELILQNTDGYYLHSCYNERCFKKTIMLLKIFNKIKKEQNGNLS